MPLQLQIGTSPHHMDHGRGSPIPSRSSIHHAHSFAYYLLSYLLFFIPLLPFFTHLPLLYRLSLIFHRLTSSHHLNMHVLFQQAARS